MLSPQTLNRVSRSYRLGYEDGYFEREHGTGRPRSDAALRPFADFDYDEGYKAGANDKRWEGR